MENDAKTALNTGITPIPVLTIYNAQNILIHMFIYAKWLGLLYSSKVTTIG
jgi:hypothetical protein